MFLLNGLHQIPLPLANCKSSGHAAFLATRDVSAFSTVLTVVRIVMGLVHGDTTFGSTELNGKIERSQVEKGKVRSRQLEQRVQNRGSTDKYYWNLI